MAEKDRSKRSFKERLDKLHDCKDKRHLEDTRRLISNTLGELRRSNIRQEQGLEFRASADGNDVYWTVSQLFSEVVTSRTDHKQLDGRNKSLENGVEAEVAQRMKDERTQYEQEINAQVEAVSKLEIEVENLRAEKKSQEDRNKVARRGIETRNDADIKRIKVQHEKDIKTLHSSHRTSLQEQQTISDSELRQKTDEHNRELSTLRNELQATKTQHGVYIKQLQNGFEQSKQRLATEFNTHKTRLEVDLANLRDELRKKLESINSEKAALKQQYDMQISHLETKHLGERMNDQTKFSGERATWEAERVKLNDTMTGMKIMHESDNLRKTQDFERRIEDLRRDHQAAVATLRNGFEEERSQWDTQRVKLHDQMKAAQAKFDSEKAQMVQDSAAALADKESFHAAKVASLRSKFQDECAEWDNKYRALQGTLQSKQTEYENEKMATQNSFDNAMASINKEFDEERARLERERIGQQAKLRDDVQYLNGALLARDAYIPLKDYDMKERFQGLGLDIDALSRIKWKSNQTQFPNDVLGRLSSNQRIIKKQLVQDLVWAVLFESIFCSPFRLFGKEGKDLELEWSKAYRKGSQDDIRGYNWPDPSLPAERWRYKTLTTLQEAVTQPASRWDPNSEMRHEFEDSLKSIAKELSDTLETLAQVDQPTQQALADTTKKAAQMWLEMMTQRCRVVIVFPGSKPKSQVDRIQEAKGGKIELVLNPELRRFGTSDGQHLDKAEIISAASTIKFPPK